MNSNDGRGRPEIRRRDFLKLGAAGAGAVIGASALAGVATSARSAAQSAAQGYGKGETWWESHPPKGGVGKPVSIDCHAHWSPEPYNKALAEIDQPLANPYILDYDLDKRRQWMDEHGVAMHCLTLSGGMPWQRTSPEQGVHLAQVINDAGVAAHTAHPDRFVIGAELPIRDPQMALKELNRIAGKPGVRAVHLPDSIERRDYLFEPAFAPVLARIEELGYPILFHQLDGEANSYGGNRVIGPPNLSAGLDAPIEHTVIATKFIITGTLDKYPGLDIVLPHAGGAFPYLAGRVEHFLYHMNAAPVKMDHPFRDYIRRFHYDYLIYYPEAFQFLITMVGSDRIVVGTDSFAAKDIQYPSDVLDQFNLPAADRERILRGNAARLLRV
jgi:aminocarboxymuconate-semialdehyde decarboxylase